MSAAVGPTPSTVRNDATAGLAEHAAMSDARRILRDEALEKVNFLNRLIFAPPSAAVFYQKDQ
jgi:hypothetical protein